MAKEEITPSEWQIMEILWACGEPLTSSEVYKRMPGNVGMSMRMVRVLMNRLNQKDILGYTVDEHDSRVYHYYVQRSREECVKEKSRKFVDSYFSGSGTNAMAALLQSFVLTDEQIKELEEILEKSRSGGQNPWIKRVNPMPDWSRIGSLLDFCAAYYTTQLVRCAAFSFLLPGLVMLLRKMLFSRRTFIRGLLWSSFLLIPFPGKLKLFYENKAVVGITGRITHETMTCLWADYIYMAGILIAAVCIFGKRLRLRKSVAGMERVSLDNTVVSVTDMNVTPFTVGLFVPKIVIPKVMPESYSREELRSVIQHERTHIRLGHLWFGLAWDVLRCLLWVNPFLTVCQKQFRADMEDICDRVCIQGSGRTAHEYGMVLLKTLKLLSSKSEGTPPAVTYAGEREFEDMKRRMGEIAGFRPYRKRMCAGMAAAAVLVIAALLLAVHTHSYARSNKNENILVYEYDSEGNAGILDYGNSIHQIISYDDSYVYVDREAFEDFLDKNNVDGDIFIVFGDFYKLPGFSSGGESCPYETGSDAGVVQIPYQSQTNDWMVTLFKIL